jgi:hypothetical protein
MKDYWTTEARPHAFKVRGGLTGILIAQCRRGEASSSSALHAALESSFLYLQSLSLMVNRWAERLWWGMQETPDEIRALLPRSALMLPSASRR